MFLWEIEWGNSTWYVFKGFVFPYQGVKDNCGVRQFGPYYIWKGTYRE